MAGLAPAIHDFLSSTPSKDVDARSKSGQDAEFLRLTPEFASSVSLNLKTSIRTSEIARAVHPDPRAGAGGKRPRMTRSAAPRGTCHEAAVGRRPTVAWMQATSSRPALRPVQSPVVDGDVSLRSGGISILRTEGLQLQAAGHWLDRSPVRFQGAGVSPPARLLLASGPKIREAPEPGYRSAPPDVVPGTACTDGATERFQMGGVRRLSKLDQSVIGCFVRQPAPVGSMGR